MTVDGDPSECSGRTVVNDRPVLQRGSCIGRGVSFEESGWYIRGRVFLFFEGSPGYFSEEESLLDRFARASWTFPSFFLSERDIFG